MGWFFGKCRTSCRCLATCDCTACNKCTRPTHVTFKPSPNLAGCCGDANNLRVLRFLEVVGGVCKYRCESPIPYCGGSNVLAWATIGWNATDGLLIRAGLEDVAAPGTNFVVWQFSDPAILQGDTDCLRLSKSLAFLSQSAPTDCTGIDTSSVAIKGVGEPRVQGTCCGCAKQCRRPAPLLGYDICESNPPPTQNCETNCCSNGLSVAQYDVDLGAGGWTNSNCTTPVAGGGGGTCTSISGVFTVARTPVQCLWEYENDLCDTSGCFGDCGLPVWILAIQLRRLKLANGNCIWRVTISLATGFGGGTGNCSCNGIQAVYESAEVTPPATCGGSFTLDKVSDNAASTADIKPCAGSLPATITVTSI